MYHKCRKEYFLLLIFLVIEVNNANIIEPIKLKVNKPDLIATPEDEPIELSENTRKMLDGEFYDPLTPELLNGRAFAKLMCQKINEESPLNISSRIDLLKELFGSFKTGCFIEPPFYCDYGSNIYLGENVYMNHDCILLDVAPIIIGKNVFIGPSVQIYTATHPVDPILRRTGEYGKTVIIENDVWIGGAASKKFFSQ